MSERMTVTPCPICGTHDMTWNEADGTLACVRGHVWRDGYDVGAPPDMRLEAHRALTAADVNRYDGPSSSRRAWYVADILDHLAPVLKRGEQQTLLRRLAKDLRAHGDYDLEEEWPK